MDWKSVPSENRNLSANELKRVENNSQWMPKVYIPNDSVPEIEYKLKENDKHIKNMRKIYPLYSDIFGLSNSVPNIKKQNVNDHDIFILNNTKKPDPILNYNKTKIKSVTELYLYRNMMK